MVILLSPSPFKCPRGLWMSHVVPHSVLQWGWDFLGISSFLKGLVKLKYIQFSISRHVIEHKKIHHQIIYIAHFVQKGVHKRRTPILDLIVYQVNLNFEHSKSSDVCLLNFMSSSPNLKNCKQ